MPRRRRRIVSNTCYEICFRARNTLPLVAYRLIKLIIGAAIARTQMDDKVVLCHDIWNGSHPHIIVVAKDSLAFVKFYAEIQKRLTDILKRLLGLDYLRIWEGYPRVTELCDLAAAKDSIAYLYANPAKDNLTDSIEEFPGYSSWTDFLQSKNTLLAKTVESFPWIRLPSVPTLHSEILSSRQDANIVRHLRKVNKERHLLIRYPNAWMKCFGIETDEEVAEVNESILSLMREKEQTAREIRQNEKKSVMGADKLRSQPILKPHTPKKRRANVFIKTFDNELRIKKIEERDLFDDQCRECLELWRKGYYDTQWPPGAFKPSLPPTVNLLPGD